MSLASLALVPPDESAPTAYRWQVYDPSEDPQVSLRADGVLGLNRPAMAVLGNARWVLALWDDTARTIGLTASPEPGRGLQVTVYKGETGSVAVRGFLKRFQIAMPAKLPALWQGPLLEEGVLILPLNAAVQGRVHRQRRGDPRPGAD